MIEGGEKMSSVIIELLKKIRGGGDKENNRVSNSIC